MPVAPRTPTLSLLRIAPVTVTNLARSSTARSRTGGARRDPIERLDPDPLLGGERGLEQRGDPAAALGVVELRVGEQRGARGAEPGEPGVPGGVAAIELGEAGGGVGAERGGAGG